MTAAFDPLAALRVLTAHGVDFVMIGGLAARLWGSPTVTNDLDICYSRDGESLVRLAAALTELDAGLRGVDEPVPFLLDAETLRSGDRFTLETTAGNLDVLATPSGTGGYDELAGAAAPMDIGDFAVLVADIEDLIRMKRAAARPKDLIEVEVLGALREELHRD